MSIITIVWVISTIIAVIAGGWAHRDSWKQWRHVINTITDDDLRYRIALRDLRADTYRLITLLLFASAGILAVVSSWANISIARLIPLALLGGALSLTIDAVVDVRYRRTIRRRAEALDIIIQQKEKENGA